MCPAAGKVHRSPERTPAADEPCSWATLAVDHVEKGDAVTGDVRREFARQLAAESLAASDPTGWFERLYQTADADPSAIPWADLAPNPMMVSWPGLHEPPRPGSRAMVVGAGLGDDAEFLASLGWATTAFDVSPSAVDMARRRFPHTGVDYVVADLLDPPAAWLRGFDLVVEAYTLQVLRDEARRLAIANTAGLVAPGGTLLVVARAREQDEHEGRMPWPLTRAEVESFPDLRLVRIEDLYDDEQPPVRRWRAQFVRDS
jgi:SAM-dependent methyltransferase